MHYPKRIVCLTTETTEVLYLLGEQDRIVGISGYTTRPAIARREKPKVAAFTTAKIDKILDLKPDLVIGFSNLQADIAAALIRAGVQVHVFNHRSIAETLNTIAMIGALVGAVDKAQQLIIELEGLINTARAAAKNYSIKPIIYFEEWNDPIITGIRWVSELIEIAGGQDCFAELAQFQSATDRTIDAKSVVGRQPDIIIGSWCGKKFQPEQVITREGWHTIPAVKNGFVREIKSADILQPGPSLFTHGLQQLQAVIQEWHKIQNKVNS
ncbi:MAG TPA: cobalamin-binding protein [Methylotenera sp.]|nr:cobalamin-binding protein [Methylotenera sp.]